MRYLDKPVWGSWLAKSDSPESGGAPAGLSGYAGPGSAEIGYDSSFFSPDPGDQDRCDLVEVKVAIVH